MKNIAVTLQLQRSTEKHIQNHVRPDLCIFPKGVGMPFLSQGGGGGRADY